jgi:formylglycine-generating enzyme required for sulfatase activity
MVGNVREWTSTAYRPYPYQANDGREDLNDETSKVLRGGTWKYGPQGARAAYRTYNHPTFTFNYVGARLARDVRI